MVIFYLMVYMIAYIYSNVMEFTWNPPVIHLESIWSPVELWNPVEWWWNQHHSMWNPDGMMESR